MTLTHDGDVVPGAESPADDPDTGGDIGGDIGGDTRPVPARRPGLPARVLLAPVNLYRSWISPVLPPSCRFDPSCSAYAVEALSTHGALRGFYLTVRRLLRCGPWHPGGYDPVPPRRRRHPDVTEGPGTPGPARDTLPKE